MADNDKDILQEARERFADCEDAWSEVRAQALDDLKFARLGEQWPQDVADARRRAKRPCMTINRMPSFARQVVNDARQNRPSIKVRPVDSGADVATADVISGLIRHIESISDADVAYDTGIENAVHGGFGFIEIEVDYACDDSFDKEIKINQVANPLAVSWDPYSEAYDSSDWGFAFRSWSMPEEQFKREYPGKQSKAEGFASDSHIAPWFEGSTVRLSKYFSKEEKDRDIVLLSDGSVIDKDVYTAQKDIFTAAGQMFVRERKTKSYEIVRRLITGAEILDTQRWRGTIIPLVPVYGDAFNIEGRRYFNSLIHDAKDSQRIFNFSRSTATELISLAPKVPFIGPKNAFTTDADKWTNVNNESYPYIVYDGNVAPQRVAFAGVPEGALQEAALASEDMREIIGMGKPSLGMADSRVISGKAKQMERHESDTGTLHFTDNQHRSIRGVGRVLLELIPQVYTPGRMIRILGHDGKAANVQLDKRPAPVPNPAPGSPPMPLGVAQVYDLAAGKYDVSIEAGPSYTTRREEAVDSLSTLISASPASAAIIGPQLVKMYDMPDSDKVTAMLATMMPPAARAIFDGTPMPPAQPDPEVQAKMAEQKMKIDGEFALKDKELQNNLILADKEAVHRRQLESDQAAADIAVLNRKTDAEIAANERKIAAMMRLKGFEAVMDHIGGVLDRNHAHALAQDAASFAQTQGAQANV